MELNLLLALQSVANPALDVLFTALSVVGEPLVAAVILSFVYWLCDKEVGEYLALSVLASLCVNGLVKNLVNGKRPIGEPGVRSLYVKTATGSSFPSGHTQNAAALCGALAWRGRTASRSLFWLAPPVLIALSRVYLGVHWPRDVLAALVLGLLVSAGVYALFCTVDEQGRELAAIALVALFLAPVLLWGDADFVKGYGMLAGFTAGILLEHRLVRFSTDGTRGKKALRWLTGLALLGVVKVGLGFVLPESLLWDGVTYGVVAFTMTFFCPALFRACRL